MMVDRSYLNSAAARNYQDRKMAKWMGFFLSEHQAALAQESLDPTDSVRLPQPTVYLWASQALSQGVAIQVTYQVALTKPAQSFTGVVTDLTSDFILLKALQGQEVRYLKLSQVLQMHLAPEATDQSGSE